MRWLNPLLECLSDGLLLAMLAPPVAVVAITLGSLLDPASARELSSVAGSGAPMLALAALTAGYLLGALPAFIAGLPLRWLKTRLPAWPAAALIGLLGLVAYFLTTGPPPWSAPHPLHTLETYGLPAFVGCFAAARLAIHLHRAR